MDCGAAEPDWGDVLHGSLHCIKCAGVHRSLGVSVSYCRSLTMDHWTEANLLAMLLGGNEQLTSFFRRQQIENSCPEALYKSKQAAYYREQLAAQVEETLAKRRRAKSSASEPSLPPPKALRPATRSSFQAVDFDVQVNEESLGASLTRALPPPGVTPLKPTRGNGSWALVTRLRASGLASRSGVKVGDYVVAMNGRAVADYDEFVSLFPRCPRPLRLTVRRFRSTSREPEKAPEPTDEIACVFDEEGPMGFSIERDDAGCARVSKVAPGGRAATQGVRIGDLLVALGDRRTPAYDVAIAALPQVGRPVLVKFAKATPRVAENEEPTPLARAPPSAAAAGGYGRSFRRPSALSVSDVLTVPDRHLGDFEDDREFDVEFQDGSLGMRIEERSGLVPITVVVSCEPRGQAHRAGVRIGCVVIGVNGEKYLSHAHTTATLRHHRRPLHVRFRHSD